MGTLRPCHLQRVGGLGQAHHKPINLHHKQSNSRKRGSRLCVSPMSHSTRQTRARAPRLLLLPHPARRNSFPLLSIPPSLPGTGGLVIFFFFSTWERSLRAPPTGVPGLFDTRAKRERQGSQSEKQGWFGLGCHCFPYLDRLAVYLMCMPRCARLPPSPSMYPCLLEGMLGVPSVLPAFLTQKERDKKLNRGVHRVMSRLTGGP